MEMEAEAERDRGEAIWNQSEAMVNVAKANSERLKAEGDAALKQAQAAQALTPEGQAPTEYLALVDALKQSFGSITDTAVDRINTTLGRGINHLNMRQQMFDSAMNSLPPINNKLDQIINQQKQVPNMDITRDSAGRVATIGGRPVSRGPNGELRGVE